MSSKIRQHTGALSNCLRDHRGLCGHWVSQPGPKARISWNWVDGLSVVWRIQVELLKHIQWCAVWSSAEPYLIYNSILCSVSFSFQLKQKGFSHACSHPKWAFSPRNYFEELKKLPSPCCLCLHCCLLTYEKSMDHFRRPKCCQSIRHALFFSNTMVMQRSSMSKKPYWFTVFLKPFFLKGGWNKMLTVLKELEMFTAASPFTFRKYYYSRVKYYYQAVLWG